MLIYQYDEDGLELTESSEGCRLEAYWDANGQCWTIGWGHTGKDVYRGLRITRDQAVILLKADLAAATRCVCHAVNTRISQHQFDALVDFCFNAGMGNFLKSTLLSLVNKGSFEAAAEEFKNWVHSGGRILPGLVSRRTKEATLFRT